MLSVFRVAPFTGAWIETTLLSAMTVRTKVAPFTGAWIETLHNIDATLLHLPSHPSRVRGLKLYRITVTIETASPEVAPFTGAWIETPQAKSR